MPDVLPVEAAVAGVVEEVVGVEEEVDGVLGVEAAAAAAAAADPAAALLAAEPVQATIPMRKDGQEHDIFLQTLLGLGTRYHYQL